jgi:hypothetical protein
MTALARAHARAFRGYLRNGTEASNTLTEHHQHFRPIAFWVDFEYKADYMTDVRTEVMPRGGEFLC